MTVVKHECPRCRGEGTPYPDHPVMSDVECGVCQGRGWVEFEPVPDAELDSDATLGLRQGPRGY